MATLIMTTYEAGVAALRHRTIKARANFLFQNAVHNRRRADHLWKLWFNATDRKRDDKALRAYKTALEMFYRRMHEQRDLLIETSRTLYLKG